MKNTVNKRTEGKREIISKVAVSSVKVKQKKKQASTSRISRLEGQVRNLKAIVSDLVYNEFDKGNKWLTVDSTVDPKLSNREKIKAICAAHAETMAKSYGVTDSKDFGTFYDITFSLLYTRFRYTHKFDIKALADKQNKTGLQIAEEYGLLDKLLVLTQKLFL